MADYRARDSSGVDTLPARRAPDSHEAFVREVHDFLAEALTDDLREAGRLTIGTHSDLAACRIWHRRLYERGWIAPAWPVAFGGTGWTARQRFAFEQVCAGNDAPVMFAAGLRSIGPLICAIGSAEQRARYLKPILSGEDLWCQGFSETGAGSDLAALTTRARRDGERYIVNGRKVWTTGAHLANRMFALVRTHNDGKPQEGITFLLIDMDSPGLTINPIITMDGEHEFNEVVFDDVSVPVANRLGAEDDGWAVAKQLMRFARTNNTNSSLLRRTWRRVCAARAENPEADLGSRFAEAEIALQTFESLEFRLLSAGRLSGDDEAGSSLMKVQATELHQTLTELLIDLAGPMAIAGGYAVQKYLATRAASIYSGTSEVHRNLLAKQVMRG
ncbi:MAG TPA: acyl-CoA dehydrogenase family protein [Rhizomicrobium sp.]|jgi:acyl-CoA dehydrogenase|nr:acyl-CoA dehydrogenase family protein [Rhizomicrobium sp.]